MNAVLILSALLLTSTLVYEAFVPKQGETFTEFYLLGQSGNAADYPTSFQLGQQKSLTVGIVNHEGSDKTYNLAITLQNGTREQLLYAEQMAVANGARWEKNITLTPDMLGTKMKMNFALYLGTDTNTVPYRETHLWVDVKPIS